MQRVLGPLAVTAAGLSLMLSSGTPVFAVSNSMSMASSAATTTPTGSPQQSPVNWQVTVGGQNASGSLMGMGFYPGIITVDAGDSVTWVGGGMEPHTVTFLSGQQPPAPNSPAFYAPAGGKVYDGTGLFSSGMIMQGQKYTLTFDKPGVYIYDCLLHPGMQGVVVVQPAGTPYPDTQAQVQQIGQSELAADLAAAQAQANTFQLTKTPGKNGTTVWHAAIDLPAPSSVTVPLSSQNGSRVTGTATLDITAPGTLQVTVHAQGLVPNSVHPEHIHGGSCAAGGGILYPLNNLVANASGDATSTTTVQGVLAIPTAGWFVNVHNGPTLQGSGVTPVACGDVHVPAYAAMRFYPNTLTIHAGDTVTWTQMDVHEIHTVTFVNPGQKLPEFPSPQANAPAGGPIYNGSGFFNSGAMLPGQTYSLTFTKPGTYTYWCLVHDQMGMKAQVVVLPSASASSPPSGQTVTVMSGDTLWSIAQRYLGNGARWGQIYSANESVIGSNPDRIFPGEILQIP